MKIQIRPVFFFAVCISALLPVGMLTAQAKAPIRECSASPSKAQGHWSWRLIDGRKCWYAGRAMISKSLLEWPARAPMQSQSSRELASVPEEPGDPMESETSELTHRNTFDALWRARVEQR